MLIFDQLPQVTKALDDYLLDIPTIEKENIDQIKSLIETALQSETQALAVYPQLFSGIKEWYQQLDLTDVNPQKAIILLQQTNKLLSALSTDCKALNWALSLLVPSSLYNEIEQLIEISQIKLDALKQHQLHASQIITTKRSTEQKLKELLNNAILLLVKKNSAIAEKKADYLLLLDQLKQLNNCLTSKNATDLQAFWQYYSDQLKFKKLMDILILTDQEKISWHHSYEYLRTNKPKEFNLENSFNTLIALSNYQSKGSSLTQSSLTSKMEHSIELLYNQIIEKSIQTSNKSEWLESIEATLEGSKINPLLHELMELQKLFNQPLLELKTSIKNGLATLNQLSINVQLTSQTDMKKIRELRVLLKNLKNNFKDLQVDFKQMYQQHNEIINHLDKLKKLSNTDDFKITEINITDLLELTSTTTQELKHKFLTQLPECINDNATDDLENIFNKMSDYLNEQENATQNILNNLNANGAHEREKALRELNKFIIMHQGLWEKILQFCSSNYRCCMAEVNSTLRSKKSSLEKVAAITKQFNQTETNSSFFIRQRVQFFSKSNKNKMFIDETAGCEKLSTHPTKRPNIF